jgi:hypothetical protein
MIVDDKRGRLDARMPSGNAYAGSDTVQGRTIIFTRTFAAAETHMYRNAPPKRTLAIVKRVASESRSGNEFFVLGTR